jgi:hypothetical protein
MIEVWKIRMPNGRWCGEEVPLVDWSWDSYVRAVLGVDLEILVQDKMYSSPLDIELHVRWALVFSEARMRSTRWDFRSWTRRVRPDVYISTRKLEHGETNMMMAMSIQR